jgi:hypothetical protein
MNALFGSVDGDFAAGIPRRVVRRAALVVMMFFVLFSLNLRPALAENFYYRITGFSGTCDDGGGGNVAINGTISRVAYLPADNLLIGYRDGSQFVSSSIPAQPPGTPGAVIGTNDVGAPPFSVTYSVKAFANGKSVGTTSITITCASIGATPSVSISNSGSGQGEQFPTSVWLADVCEPLDGFSSDGWTTVGSNAAVLPWGTGLFVATGPDGPWTETSFIEPPYIISHDQMDALVAMLGVAGPEDVWMRAGSNGTAARYGSMVIDRAAHMDALCGTE